jgi:hypothetical protein
MLTACPRKALCTCFDGRADLKELLREALARTEVLHEAMQVEAMAEFASRRLEKQKAETNSEGQ